MRSGSFFLKLKQMVEYPIHNSPYFDVREWVDERTWGMLGPKAAWQIDPRIVRVADKVRELSGAGVMINNWHYRVRGVNKYQSSGFRAKWDSTGAVLSQHRRGCAADLKVKGLTPGEVLDLIQANKGLFLEIGLTTFENIAATPTWLHLDTRPSLDGMPDSEFLKVDP